MADGSATRNPATVRFVEFGDKHLIEVTSFSVRQQMSELFQVTVEGLADQTADGVDGANIDFTQVVGKGAEFHFKHHADELVWRGVVASFRQKMNQPEGGALATTWEVIIAPGLWRTTLRRNCRVFMHKDVKDVIDAVLGDWEISHRWDALTEDHFKHEFRAQYNESDYDFICRILEEEGISYYFEHPSMDLVLTDAPQTTCPRFAAPMPYRAHARHRTYIDGENAVWDVQIAQDAATGAALVRDFDFRRPDVWVRGEAHVEPAGSEYPEKKYEDYWYEHGAGWVTPRGAGDIATPIADNPLKYGSNDIQLKMRAQRELDAARWGKLHVSCSTGALHLTAGQKFAVGQGATNPGDKHRCAQVTPDRELLVIGRYIHGSPHGIERSVIDAVPSDTPHRPRKKTPKPRIPGLQSALVVGPPNQEIHTDEFGRVRVQFAWDREGAYSETSSCWIRVAHGWSGAGFGVINIPRVGHEVLVGFFDGDPDRPVIVGSSYDMKNPVPYKLPDHKTRSGWRTQTSFKPEEDHRDQEPRGYNELMFEDAKYEERIHIQAERDYSTIVKKRETRDDGAGVWCPECNPEGKEEHFRITRIINSDTTHLRHPMKSGMEAHSVHAVRVGTVAKKFGNGIQIDALGQNSPDTPGVITIATRLDADRGASITLSGEDIYLNATGEIHFHAKNFMDISCEAGAININSANSTGDPSKPGGGDVNINCAKAHPAAVAFVRAAERAHNGEKEPPPWYPGPQAPQPVPPLDYEQFTGPPAPNEDD